MQLCRQHAWGQNGYWPKELFVGSSWEFFRHHHAQPVSVSRFWKAKSIDGKLTSRHWDKNLNDETFLYCQLVQKHIPVLILHFKQLTFTFLICQHLGRRSVHSQKNATHKFGGLCLIRLPGVIVSIVQIISVLEQNTLLLPASDI